MLGVVGFGRCTGGPLEKGAHVEWRRRVVGGSWFALTPSLDLPQTKSGRFLPKQVAVLSEPMESSMRARAGGPTPFPLEVEGLEKQSTVAGAKIRCGHVSQARHVLTGASLAPRTEETFDLLQGRKATAISQRDPVRSDGVHPGTTSGVRHGSLH